MNPHIPTQRCWPSLTRFDPAAGQTVRAPLGGGPGWWVGAPSAIRDADSGLYYLYYRYRKPRELGRGVECRIARSADGCDFEDVWSAGKADLNTQSMEKSGLFKLGDRWLLYLSFVGEDGRWRIEAAEANRPEAFDTRQLRPVLAPDDCDAEGVKDPAVYEVEGRLTMIVSYAPKPRRAVDAGAMHSTGDVYNTGLLKSHTGLATSTDGLAWQWEGDILTPPEAGWDSYCTRLGSVVRGTGCWLGFYDGSASVAENYEEKVGLCASLDLRHWQRLTTDGPLVLSPHASGSVRYVEALAEPQSVLLYYEYALPDGSHDLRVQRLPL
ncbi:hypothetical protein LLH23_21035 [bacterium]|nr:hypothetical protein [bacterium]